VLIGIGLVVLTVLAGLILVLTHDEDETTAAAAGPIADRPGSAGGPAGGDPSAGTTLPPGTVSTVPAGSAGPAEAPPPAGPNDCVAVTSAGDFLGTGSCVDGGAPYLVTEVLDSTGVCADPGGAWIIEGSHILCLQLNLVETYCYVFPAAGTSGFITPAGACEAPGTVHVIDVVPGATDDSGCTTQFEWNRWYAFTSPQMVVCAMVY
jgi:hypothetical protein